MATVTVSTKEEFERAVNNNEDKIIVTGTMAQKIIDARKKKSAGKKIGIASVLAVGAGLALAPFTAGTSAVAALATTSALTIGAVTLTTAEVIIICGTALAALGIAASVIDKLTKNYDVKITAGSTTVECIRKK